MKILRFDIQNDKKVASFLHDTNGEHVAFAGPTATGKTTAASALWDIANKSADSLRHGERKGHIILHLGDDGPDIIASRTFTKKTNTVKIEGADGRPGTVADFRGMISHLSENPHKIAEMKPTERINTLLQAADLGDVDLNDLDAAIAQAEQERLDAKRRADDFAPGLEPEKATPVDVSAISAALEEAQANNRTIEDDARDIAAVVQSGKTLTGEIAAWEKRIAELERELEGVKEEHREKTAEREEMAAAYKRRKTAHDKMTPTDTTELRAQMASSTEVNAKAAKHEQWEERRRKHATLSTKRDAADDKVKDLREQKKELLDGAKWPIPGLSIDGADIMYRGCLFDNLGQSEQMLVCAALAIKDILAHPLRVVRMDGVESMSKEDFTRLQDLFGDAGIQVISTRVARDDVEDGELVIEEVAAPTDGDEDEEGDES